MLTPPYHFAIVACPPVLDGTGSQDELLYRGSLPAVRNLPFLKRLKLKTVVYLQKKPLAERDPLMRWAERHVVSLVWIKAGKMGEEDLGMGRQEIGEVLKVVLDPSAYPLCIADKDGISHTTLITACLRKLQGWHADSILDEIARFEPDYEDLPLIPFVTSYLTAGPSSDALILPAAPFPAWLWPAFVGTSQPDKPANSGGQAVSGSGSAVSRSNTITREREPSAPRERAEKDKDRERATATSVTPGPLPFPNPLVARKHPTMKLTFPLAPPSVSTATSASPNQSHSPMGTLSRVNSRREVRSATLSSAAATASHGVTEEGHSLIAAATSILSSTLQSMGISGQVSSADSPSTTRNADGGHQETLVDVSNTVDIVESQAQHTSPPREPSIRPDKLPHEPGKPTRNVSFREERGAESNSGSQRREKEQQASGDPTRPMATAFAETKVDAADRSTVPSRASQGGGNSASFNGGSASGAPPDDRAVDIPDGLVPGVKSVTEHPSNGSEGPVINDQMEDGGDEEEEEEEEEDDDDDDEADDDDDDDDEQNLEPTSLHISALDLAGYG